MKLWDQEAWEALWDVSGSPGGHAHPAHSLILFVFKGVNQSLLRRTCSLEGSDSEPIRVLLVCDKQGRKTPAHITEYVRDLSLNGFRHGWIRGSDDSKSSLSSSFSQQLDSICSVPL